MTNQDDTLARLICLFEDYTIRRCWPQETEQSLTLSIVPTLVFDMSGGKVQAIRVSPGSDGRILVELSKFEKVYLAASMPNGTRDEVGYSMYLKSQHWLLCAATEIPELRKSGYECIESIWNAPPDRFPDLLWGLIRWQIRQEDFQQLRFVVSSDGKTKMVKSALGVLTQSKPNAAEKLRLAQVLQSTDPLRGFLFLDDPHRPPEEGEQMLLLYTQEGYADLFQWSLGRFTCRRLTAEQTIDLTLVSRLAICSEMLDRPSEGVLLFHSVQDFESHAIAHYVMWQPVLHQWEAERKRRYVQHLQRRVAQLEDENRDMEVAVQRSRYILERLSANPPLNTGGDVCLHSESTSAPPPP
jgi:hypothetical protein